MILSSDKTAFAEMALPHLDAAYNLARWLTRDPSDAADVVQESMMRALRFFGGYRGGNGKAWLLAIVRNTAFDWLKTNRPHEIVTSSIGSETAFDYAAQTVPSTLDDPETALIRAGYHRHMDSLIAALPPEFRECLVLRELEELSYKEIAHIADIPIGTVMSRLARARRLIQQGWTAEEARHE